MMKTSCLTFSLIAAAQGCIYRNNPANYKVTHNEVAHNEVAQNVFASCNLDAAVFCGSAGVSASLPFLDLVSFPASPFFGGIESYFDSAFAPPPISFVSSSVGNSEVSSNEVTLISNMLDDMMVMSLDVGNIGNSYYNPLLKSSESLPSQVPPAVVETYELSFDSSEIWEVVQNVFDEMVGSLIEHVENDRTKTSGDNGFSGIPSPQRLSEMIDGFANKVLSDSSAEVPRKRLARRLTEIESSPSRRRLQSIPSFVVSTVPNLGYGINSDVCLYNLYTRNQPSVLSPSCMEAIDSFISGAGSNLDERREEQKSVANSLDEEIKYDNALFYLSSFLILMFALSVAHLSDSRQSDKEVMPRGERRALKRKILCAVYGNDELKHHVEVIIGQKFDDVPILRGKLTKEKIALKRKILVTICRHEKLKRHVESIVGEEVNVFFDILKDRIARNKTPRSLMHRFCQNLPYITVTAVLVLTSIMNPSLVLVVCGPALIVTAVYGCLSGLCSAKRGEEAGREEIDMGYPGAVAMKQNVQTRGLVDGSSSEVFVAVPLSEPLLVV